MNKSELVAIMAEKASLSKKDAEGAFRLCRLALSVALAVPRPAFEGCLSWAANG